MLVKDFFQKHNFSFNPKALRRSPKTYENSDTSQMYYKLPEYVDGFCFMTFSCNAVEALQSEEISVKDLEVSYDQEYGWKAQLPDSTEVWEGIKW